MAASAPVPGEAMEGIVAGQRWRGTNGRGDAEPKWGRGGWKGRYERRGPDYASPAEDATRGVVAAEGECRPDREWNPNFVVALQRRTRSRGEPREVEAPSGVWKRICRRRRLEDEACYDERGRGTAHRAAPHYTQPHPYHHWLRWEEWEMRR
jgi:hypothetical protein